MSEEVEVTPEVTPETTPVSMLNDEGKFSEEYLKQLPDGLGDHSVFKKYDNPVDMIRGTVNAQKLVGEKAEEFWKSEDPDVVARRKQIMGIPESKDEYQFDLEQVPEQVRDIAKERIEKFKDYAFEKGWSKQMVEDALAFDAADANATIEAAQNAQMTSLREAEETLREEWKGAKYDYNISKVSDALDFIGLGEYKDDPKYANDPQFVKAVFDNVVPLIDNDTLVEARQSESLASVTDALSSLESKMNAFDGNTSSHEYQNMVKQRGELLMKISEK